MALTARVRPTARPVAGARRRPPWILLGPALVAAAVALSPLAYLLIRASADGLAAAVDLVLSERTLRLTVRSLALAACVSACCLVVGVSLAWLVTRTRLPLRRGVAVVAALPLAVPSYVAAYTWLSAFPRLDPFLGSLLVLTLVSYPYVLLPVAAALERTDPALEEVARGLGRSPWATFVTVTLRQVRPAAAAGALLVALYVLSDFGAVALLRYDSFTRAIYTSYTASFDRTPAAVLSLVLVAVTSLVLRAEHRSRGRAAQARLGSGVPRRHRPVELGRAGTAVAALWSSAVLGLAVVFPSVSLGYWLVRGRSARLDAGRLAEAAATTIGVSVLGALLTVALAVPVGILAARYTGGIGRRLEQACFVGHALPGIVVALAMVFLSTRLAYPLYQTVPLVVFAYAVLFLPAAVGSVRASVALSPPLLEDVARSLGRRPREVVRAVTLPLAGPGVAAGAALVLLTCMKELPATLLLRPTGMDTLATRLWTETSVGAYAAAAPYAALLVLLAAVPAALLGPRRSATMVPTAARTGAPARPAGAAAGGSEEGVPR
jgi:iron(III) transport system permease protein